MLGNKWVYLKGYCVLFLLVSLVSCDHEDEPSVNLGQLKMGFTSWSFGPNLQDVDDTYAFIESNANIYAEHIDNNIPWSAWINSQELPAAFTNEINGKVSRKIAGKDFLLSISLLNSNRDELASDFDGTIPAYDDLDNAYINEAYFKHVNYLVEAFEPDYLVIAIEVNEFRLRSPEKWNAYQRLMEEVTDRIKQAYPDLKVSESISLHNLIQSDAPDHEAYVEEMLGYMNQMDFVAISFYPFFRGFNTKREFQSAFDFLHTNVTAPIAFVETAHLAENLSVPNLNVSIDGDENGQRDYLETLIENANALEYEFIIWWAHRDYDALWLTSVKR
ncbi:MAG: glycosyl hydrolase 53 family protein [Cytophagales bacterium]|nr:glycosyl hydrolase 53 family protein [Cytophagales bacterium]